MHPLRLKNGHVRFCEFFLLIMYLFLFHNYGCSACLHVCMKVLKTPEVRDRLRVTMWVLELEPRSS